MTECAGQAEDSATRADSPREPVAVPDTPVIAQAVFGDRLPIAEHYVRLLADTGITHGLIGPREAPRLWSRHVIAGAAVAELIPRGAASTAVIDVGSGAGLPGLCLAIARSDLEVHLVEPLARRTTWLSSAVEALGLTNVQIHTARAEKLWGDLQAPYVTARAVAKLEQLATWTLPLLTAGGTLLALKGERAEVELTEARARLRRLGADRTDIALVGLGLIDSDQPKSREPGQPTGGLEEPVRIVRVGIDRPVDLRAFRRTSPSSSGSARRRTDRRRPDHRDELGSARAGRPTPRPTVPDAARHDADLPEGDRP